MARDRLTLLACAALCAVVAPLPARAQAAEPFTLTCVNTGGKSIYFSIDLAAKRWALMKANGDRDSKIQEVAMESDDMIRLRNPGGYFNVNRKTGAMDLIKGESRRVDRIACRKHDSYIPIPKDEAPANKF